MDSKTIRRALRGGLYLIALTVILFPALPALAQVNFTTDEAQFLAQNPDLAFQDFVGSKVVPVSSIVCPAPADSASDNDCFSPGTILPGIEFLNGPILDPVTGLFLVGEGSTSAGEPPGPVLTATFTDNDFEIVFDPGVNRAGLTLGCISKGSCDADVQVVVFDTTPQFLAETTVHVTSGFNTFLGISTQAQIGNISIRNANGDFSEKGVLNVWFGTRVPNQIPTLSEWGMIAAAAGLGLVGVFFAVKRKRRALNS